MKQDTEREMLNTILHSLSLFNDTGWRFVIKTSQMAQKHHQSFKLISLYNQSTLFCLLKSFL